MTAAAPFRVVRAATALARAQLRVLRRPVGALVAADAGAGARASPGVVTRRDAPARAVPVPDVVAPGVATPALELRVARATAAVGRAERLLPWRPSCLVRALALADLLARDGVPGSLIRLGVRRDGGAMDAHAWVEIGGRVVGDDPAVARRFTPLGAVTPARRP